MRIGHLIEDVSGLPEGMRHEIERALRKAGVGFTPQPAEIWSDAGGGRIKYTRLSVVGVTLERLGSMLDGFDFEDGEEVSGKGGRISVVGRVFRDGEEFDPVAEYEEVVEADGTTSEILLDVR